MEDPTVPVEAIAKRMQAFRAARMQFDGDFADAEQLLLQEQWLDRTSGSSAFALRDLREQLAQLKPLTETYANETDACLAAIASRLLPEARRRLVTVDGLRQELGQRLEAMRAGMADVLNAISREAEAAHARAEKVAIIVFVLSSILGLGVAALGGAPGPLDSVRRSRGGGR
jgi:hypothetical protein